MAKAKFLVVYCLFISGLCCMANVTKDINMRFKDVRQGLSHQTVNCFYQDEFGFLWIGTQDGLNRFDGRKFEVFKPDNANPYSININNIRQVCGNKAGLLFIRSLQSVTLYDMRLNRFRVLREGEVAGICYAHDALWIATGKEIYRYRNLDQAPELFFSFPSKTSVQCNLAFHFQEKQLLYFYYYFVILTFQLNFQNTLLSKLKFLLLENGSNDIVVL